MIRFHRGNLRMILIVFAILFMSYNAKSFNAGVIVFIGGLVLHFISKGFLYRNRELAIRGPYSFTRHPFYIANLLLDIGIIFMSGHLLFIPVYLILYYKAYHKVILNEEADLADIYGDLYKKYMRKVPRYFPKIIPYVKDWHRGFKWENILREREISRVLRLITYPISFLIIHEIIKYKLYQPKLMQVLLGVSFVIILLCASYLFHNMVERNRIFRNISAKTVNLYYFILILAIGGLLVLINSFGIKSDFLILPLTLFFSLVGILFVLFITIYDFSKPR